MLKTPVLVQYIYIYPPMGINICISIGITSTQDQDRAEEKGQAEVHPTRVRKRVLSYHIHLVSTLNIPNWYWVLFKPLGVLSTMFSIHRCIFHSHRIWATRVKKNSEEEEPKNSKKWTNLDPSLNFDSSNHELSCKLVFFGSRSISSPSKMMPCKLNHNLICLHPGPLSKNLGTNLKFLTNKNAWFHWTLLHGPLSKVTLIMLTCCMKTFNKYLKILYIILWFYLGCSWIRVFFLLAKFHEKLNLNN
jgi:hypothetical protein